MVSGVTAPDGKAHHLDTGSMGFTGTGALSLGGISMLVTIALILLVLWALGFFAFNVAGGLIHVLLVIAVIVGIMHLVRGRRVV
jgi:hypothetical protein